MGYKSWDTYEDRKIWDYGIIRGMRMCWAPKSERDFMANCLSGRGGEAGRATEISGLESGADGGQESACAGG